MAFPTYTYTFSNSTTADATQINQNFTDILNGISDSTKDISVNAITAAGASTLNGNVTFGNSSAKTITFSGSLASSIPVSANTSWDFGASTLGLRSVYIGGTSTFTTRITSAATASWTLNLPVTAGAANNYLKTDGSGNTSWSNPADNAYAVASKTTTYSILTTDHVILCSGASWTMTLPDATAAGTTGKVYIIQHGGTSLTQAYTINTTSAQTVGGIASGSYILQTNGETLTLVSDGSNWQILNHQTITGWQSYTPTFAGIGTPSSISVLWMREGQNAIVRGTAKCGTVAAALFSVTLPGGSSLNTSAIVTAKSNYFGDMIRAQASTTNALPGAGSGPWPLTDNSGSDTAALYLANGSNSTNPLNLVNGSTVFTTSDVLVFRFSAPISGWQP